MASLTPVVVVKLMGKFIKRLAHKKAVPIAFKSS